MKKSIRLIFTALFMLTVPVLISSCGRKVVNIDDQLPELPPPVGFETEAVTEKPAAVQPEQTVYVPEHLLGTITGLKPGLWYAYSETGSSYYYFYPDRDFSGFKISTADGVTAPFEYEKREKYYLFHFTRVDDNTSIEVEYKDDEHVNFLINGTYTEKLEYMSDVNYNEFMFYTNDELIRKAASHYAYSIDNPKLAGNLSGNVIEKPDSMAVVQVTKQVFDNGVGVHRTEICETYTVSRLNAKGTDSAGQAVNLSK